jgi:phosphinothricin acetyltransferase
MPASATIRLALEEDAAEIAEIYRPFCESSAVSFEYVAPSAEEIASRLRAIAVQFPWLVLDDGGAVIGYAYASRHSERAAYGWSVNTAVYVREAHRRCGVGRALYTSLFQLLAAQGYFKAYAGITLPNPGSTGLHESFGFTPVGTYKGVGYKHGAWHDVIWYQRALQDQRMNPDPPVPIAAVVATTAHRSAFTNGVRHYRATE